MSANLDEFDFGVFDHANSGFDGAMRLKGLTGSDVAAIFGRHKNRSAWDVYATKTGIVKDIVVENEGTEIGTMMQLPVCAIYQKRSGNRVQWSDKTIQHEKYPWMVCTPDGFLRQLQLDGRRGIYEGKTAGARMVHLYGEEWSDDIPDQHLFQATWNLMCSEHDFCDFGVLLGTQPLSVRCYRVEYDKDLAKKLFEGAKAFWFDHVVARRPPEITASKLADAYLSSYSNTSTFRAPSEVESGWLDELRALEDATAKIDEGRIEDLRTKLRESIGTADGLLGEFGKASYRRNKEKVTVNWAAVVDEVKPDPAVIEKHTKRTPGARPLVVRFK